MDELSIKKKLNYWLSLKKEADGLEKNFKLEMPIKPKDPVMNPATPPKPASDSYKQKATAFIQKPQVKKDESQWDKGINKPYANKQQRAAQEPSVGNTMAGISQSGFSVRSEDLQPVAAKEEHKKIISELKKMPKPNLPKSEEKGVHQRSIIPNQTTPHMESHSSSSTGDDVRSMKVAWNSKARGNAISAHHHIIQQLKSMPKPNLPKTEKSEPNEKKPLVPPPPELPQHEDHVAGIPLPPELKQHADVVPYDHPHREIAAKFVTDVYRKNKYDGLRMGKKYLGIDDQGKGPPPNYATIKSEAIPAIINENRVGGPIEGQQNSGPAIINGPTLFNAYKHEGTRASGEHMLVSDIVKFLKSKKLKQG